MTRFASTLFFCTLAVLTGCGESSVDSDRPVTHPVRGTVLLNGAPVAGAQVAFNPEGPDGHGAFARTDANGRFQLTTFESGDGAVAGKFVVTVTKFAEVAATEGATEESYVPPEAGGTKLTPPKNELPAKFSQRQTSGLTAEVKADSENTFDFDLAK